MEIIDYPSPNYFDSSLPIRAICLHGTAGSLQSSLGWLTNPKSQASANYVIAEDGKIYRLVSCWKNQRAWANGNVKKSDRSLIWLNEAIDQGINPNLVTISIEHVASSQAMITHGRLTDAAWRSSQDLVKKLLADYNLVASGQTVVGHYQLDSVDRPYCPGVINIPAYIDKLLGR